MAPKRDEPTSADDDDSSAPPPHNKKMASASSSSSSSPEPFARLGDVDLRAADVGTLRSGCWLNDQVISYLFESLSQRALAYGASLVLLEPTTTFMAVMVNDAAALKEMLSVPQKSGAPSLLSKLEQAQLVLMPVNNNDDASQAEGGGHWSLLIFRRAGDASKVGKARFEHYDSCGGANGQVAKAVALAMSTLLLGPKPGTLQLVNMECPQQRNMHDCGVYVLAFAEVLALAPPEELGRAPSEELSKRLKAITADDVSAKRQAWCEELAAAVEAEARG